MHQIRLMPDSYPASLCPYALMLIVYMRNSKKSFYSLIRLRFEPETNAPDAITLTITPEIPSIKNWQ